MIKKYHAVIFTMCKVSNIKSFGAHKIAHELRTNGFEVLVINHLNHFSITELKIILSSVVSDQTLFVGISNTFVGWSDVKKVVAHPQMSTFMFMPGGPDDEQEFTDCVKQINPNCKIVVGGARTQIDWQNKCVDYAVVGYADISVVNLAKHLKYGTPITNKNYKNIYGVHIIDDELAEGFDFNNSTMTWCEDDVVMSQEVLPMEISRGCIFSCKFCNYRLNGKQTLDYLKDLGTIQKELLDNYNNYGITRYRLLDDTFNDTEEKIDIMLDIVNQLPFKPLFYGYARLDLLASKPHTIKKLIDMGFRGMFFGIETLNKKTGAIIGKGADPDKLVQTIIDMKQEYGDQISLIGSFICGLPGESKESITLTMERLLSREIPLDSVAYHPMVIGNKSILSWNSAVNLDLIKFGYKEIDNEYSKTISPLINWQSDIMNYQEAIQMTTDFYQKFRKAGNFKQENNMFLLDNFGDPDFIHKYKKELFDLIKKNHSIAQIPTTPT
jgi:radical SAM superfamily enzyme YgiQ (UPF0313 family)